MLSLSWLSNVTAGHTKRVTVNAIMLIAYCTGNAAAPFMWQEKYKPRYAYFHTRCMLSLTESPFLNSNHIPWLIIGVCYVVCPILFLIIRYMLAAENKRRDQEPPDDTYDDVYIEIITEDGKRVQKKVDKVSSCAVNLTRADVYGGTSLLGISGPD